MTGLQDYHVYPLFQKAKAMEHKEITEKIIGCAYAVYNKMGFGFLESVYEKCLMIELNKIGLKTHSQKSIKVRYEGIDVGDFIADIIIEDRVLVELKSVSRLAKSHEIQLVNYLVATGISVGLLINFGDGKVEIKRKVKELTNKDTVIYRKIHPILSSCPMEKLAV